MPTVRHTLTPPDQLTNWLDNPEAFHGAPVGLQVMCRRLEEELSLRLAEIITNACQYYVP